MKVFAAMRYWGPRHYAVAASAAALWAILSGTPTDIVDTPLFVRMTPVVWWDYPFWVAGAVLVGLLAATYVPTVGVERLDGTQGEKLLGGGLLSVFAVGCPVCNKLVVLALGAGGSFARLSPDELKSALEEKDFTFVNVHIPFEGDIAGSDLSIPYDEIGQEKNLDRLPGKDAKIVLYCRSGSMSAEAARTLVRLGYENVRDLNGGMIAWENAGYRLEGV